MAGSGPRSGLWPISDGALRIALYTGLPLAAGYYLIQRSRKGDPYRTDFDGFLKAMEEPGSTGLTHSASKDSGKGQGLTSGSIDKFFRDAGEDEDTRNPLDFDSFLRGAAKASSGTSVTDHAKKATPEAPKEQAKAHHIRVALLYGTEYGFSKEVTEILATQLKATDTYW